MVIPERAEVGEQFQRRSAFYDCQYIKARDEQFDNIRLTPLSKL
jgi:hypothetical protein